MLSRVPHALRLAPFRYLHPRKRLGTHGDFPLILVMGHRIFTNVDSFAASLSGMIARSLSLLLLYEYIQGL